MIQRCGNIPTGRFDPSVNVDRDFLDWKSVAFFFLVVGNVWPRALDLCRLASPNSVVTMLVNTKSRPTAQTCTRKRQQKKKKKKKTG